MPKRTRLLIAIAALVVAGVSTAGASQPRQFLAVSAAAPMAAVADIRQAFEAMPADLGAPSAGSGENRIAKTGIWSSVKGAAKKIGGAVKTGAGAVTSAAKAVGGAIKTAAKKAAPVVKKIIKVLSKLPKPGPGPGPGPTIPTPRR